jgi:hypothetical protein
MIRTQVSLEETDYKMAKKTARAQGISVAEFVRRAVRQSLPPSKSDRSKPWMKFAGMVKTGDPNSSQTIDEVIYGPRK